MATKDVAFVVKVDDRTFTLDKFTFGDWRMLKTHFGLDSTDILLELPGENGQSVTALNIGDPNVLVGVMVAALSHERPGAPIPELIAEVDALDIDGLEFPDDKAEDEPDPTPAGNGEDAPTPPKKPGSAAKTRKNSGKGN